MSTQEVETARNTWWKEVLNHIEECPTVKSIVHTVGLLGTFIIISITVYHYIDAKDKWTQTQVAAEIEKARIAAEQIIKERELHVRRAEAEAMEALALSATNPYVLERAKRQNDNPESLTTNALGYEVGSTDLETINLEPITVKGKTYSPQQRRLMTMTHKIWSEVGFPETGQTILLMETRAGQYGDRIGDTNLPMGQRSYGVFQVKIATAKKVLRAFPKVVERYFPNERLFECSRARKKTDPDCKKKLIRDEEIMITMITDDEFNCKIAALNFAMEYRAAGKNWSKGVVAYNQGQGGMRQLKNHKEHIYYKKFISTLYKEVRPFNEVTGLSD